MKKVILMGVLATAAVASTQANATTQSFCSAPTAAAPSTVTPSNGATYFVKAAFTPRCSANVYLTGDDMINYYRAGAASGKGKTAFSGSTAGGGVAASATCATCTASDANTAATAGASS